MLLKEKFKKEELICDMRPAYMIFMNTEGWHVVNCIEKSVTLFSFEKYDSYLTVLNYAENIIK